MIGQFFTPPAAAKNLFRMLEPPDGARIIDPSCGDGVFVRHAPRHCQTFACEIDPACFAGVEPLLPAERFIKGDALTALAPLLGTFDIAVGNPPFSAQAHLEKRPDVLAAFDLGARRASQCLEVLFIELFVRLVKPGGRIAVILPDGPFSNRPFAYVRRWLLAHTRIEAIISLPRGIFSATTAKTNILVAEKKSEADTQSQQHVWLRECTSLDDLAHLELPRDSEENPDWHRALLTATSDWRPEAHIPVQASTLTTHHADAPARIRLGDVFDLRTGFALYAERRELFPEPAPDRILLLRAKNLSPEGGLQLSRDVAYIRRNGPFFNARGLVEPGEILFVRVGAGCYGRAAVVPDKLTAQADDWIHILRPKTEIKVAALVRWFHSTVGRAELRRIAKGVGTLSISKPSLANLLIPAEFVRAPVRPAQPQLAL